MKMKRCILDQSALLMLTVACRHFAVLKISAFQEVFAIMGRNRQRIIVIIILSVLPDVVIITQKSVHTFIIVFLFVIQIMIAILAVVHLDIVLLQPFALAKN